MTSQVRVVIDPNIYIAAVIEPDGVCGQLLDAINDDALTPVACPLLLDELRAVLSRPKVRQWVTNEGAAAFSAAVRARSEIESDPRLIPSATRDSADDYLVALAVETHADAIVSGDSDLLTAVLPVPVWSPRETLDRLTDPTT